MKIEIGSYLVFNHGDSKMLGQVEGIGDTTVDCVLEKNRQNAPERKTIRQAEILAVLGKKPPVGSVFGVSVEPYWRTLEHDDWGDIHFYARPEKDHVKAIMSGLTSAWKILAREKLTGFKDAANLRVEIRDTRGKNLGMYYFKQKGENALDRMFFRVQEHAEADLYREVILHESGHGVFYRLMTLQQRTEWIKLHKHFAQFARHTKEDVISMRGKFARQKLFIKDFLESLENEADEMLFLECLANVRMNFRLKNKHIDELVEVGAMKEIASMWPKEALDYTNFEMAINEYASTSPQELMAEAFRLYHTKRELLPAIKSVMEKQLTSCRGR